MKSLKKLTERRQHLRISMDLPLEYCVLDSPHARGGMVINASETGFLIRSVKDIPKGIRLNIAVLFPKGFELNNFKVLAEIIWKDICWEEDWEGHEYGTKFVQIEEEDLQKLKQLLSEQVLIPTEEDPEISVGPAAGL